MNTQLLPSPGIGTPARLAHGPAPVRETGRFTGQHRRRLLRADALTVAVTAWSSLAAAVALWLADGGLTALSSPVGMITTLGIVAGLAGMELVLLMLLLAARIPFIDGPVGSANL